ncbi:MAG TPA: bifunctional nuclease family protein [Spirochaetia bacterium]|nr:bifunctional nuclease family protein [Spirochaetia bacterium]
MLVLAEIWTVARTDKGNAVLVKPLESERAVPIFIGHLEAQSILIGLGKVPMPRPLTHDLFLSVLEQLSVQIECVEITELKDGTFYARIQMKHEGKSLAIDSRPSDALGLAARLHCPVYIADTVVEEAGIEINLITDDETQVLTEVPQETERGRLEEALKNAIDEENYEEAARIRDRLNQM